MDSRLPCYHPRGIVSAQVYIPHIVRELQQQLVIYAWSQPKSGIMTVLMATMVQVAFVGVIEIAVSKLTADCKSFALSLLTTLYFMNRFACPDHHHQVMWSASVHEADITAGTAAPGSPFFADFMWP